MDDIFDTMDLNDFDAWNMQMEDVFSQVEDYAIMENFQLQAELEKQQVKITEQDLIIQQLKQRISALESAVLWCGEACFDELAEDKSSGFVKIK